MQEQFSRTQFPSGGWEYYQAETNWTAPTPKSSTFDQTVILILSMRQKNPAMTLRTKWAMTIEGVGNDLEAYTRARLGMAPTGQDFPKMSPPAAIPQLAGAALQAVAEVKKRAAGAAFLLEWEESGLPPSSPDISERRAGVCVTCPKNNPEKTLFDYFTVKASEMIRKRFERLFSLGLKTSVDEKLNVCEACLCPLRLKVHSPRELIDKRIKPEQRAELHPNCWILNSSD